MTDRINGLGNLALSYENIANLTHVRKVLDCPISWTAPGAEYSNSGTVRVWITREGQWVLAFYSDYSVHKTLVHFICDDVHKVIETLRDVPHSLYTSQGDWTRMASIPLNLARGLRQLVETTVKARNEDQETAKWALRYVDEAFPK